MGNAPLERRDRSSFSPSGWFVSPAQTPSSLTASQGAARSEVATAQDAGWTFVEHRDRLGGTLEVLVTVCAHEQGHAGHDS